MNSKSVLEVMKNGTSPASFESVPQLRLVAVDDLVPNPANARTHPEEQVAQIAASIRQFGFTNPLLVDKDAGDIIVAGHGRRLAVLRMMEAGETVRLPDGRALPTGMVPVIDCSGWSDAQRRAYTLADNALAETSEWDDALLNVELRFLDDAGFDLPVIGFSTADLDRLLAIDPDADGDDGGSTAPISIPEPPRNPASCTGDLWLLGDHRLLCGDSTNHDDVRRLMNGERAILFATDPPYLVDYDGTNHPTQNKDWSHSYGTTWDDSSQGPELYDGFIAAAVAEAIAGNAAWYCWHASRRQAMLEECWTKAGAFVHQQIIWVKDRGVLTRSCYLWKHEPCLMGWVRPNKPPIFGDLEPTTWMLPSYARDERPDHPTPKPLDAFGIPMRRHVARGGLCYEPFCGSGSQIMAGEENGRRVNAMEIGPAYVDVAIERWQAETGKDAILDGDGRTFAEVKAERLGDDSAAHANTTAVAPEFPASPDSGHRKRKAA